MTSAGLQGPSGKGSCNRLRPRRAASVGGTLRAFAVLTYLFAASAAICRTSSVDTNLTGEAISRSSSCGLPLRSVVGGWLAAGWASCCRLKGPNCPLFLYGLVGSDPAVPDVNDAMRVPRDVVFVGHKN